MNHFTSSGRWTTQKHAIAASGGIVTIVEGEVGVWSLQAMDIGNVIGTYGITTRLMDIDVILNEIGDSVFVY